MTGKIFTNWYGRYPKSEKRVKLLGSVELLRYEDLLLALYNLRRQSDEMKY